MTTTPVLLHNEAGAVAAKIAVIGQARWNPYPVWPDRSQRRL